MLRSSYCLLLYMLFLYTSNRNLLFRLQELICVAIHKMVFIRRYAVFFAYTFLLFVP